MRARITNDAYVTSTSCGSSTKLVGSFAPDSPIVIEEGTSGLQVTFLVTNTGMTVVPGGSNTVGGFGSGPFRPKFEIW